MPGPLVKIVLLGWVIYHGQNVGVCFTYRARAQPLFMCACPPACVRTPSSRLLMSSLANFLIQPMLNLAVQKRGASSSSTRGVRLCRPEACLLETIPNNPLRFLLLFVFEKPKILFFLTEEKGSCFCGKGANQHATYSSCSTLDGLGLGLLLGSPSSGHLLNVPNFFTQAQPGPRTALPRAMPNGLSNLN